MFAMLHQNGFQEYEYEALKHLCLRMGNLKNVTVVNLRLNLLSRQPGQSNSRFKIQDP